MREIKFRVVDQDGDIVAFEYVDPNDGWFHTLCFNNSNCPGPFNDKGWGYKSILIREQYIGINDKANVPIFEGDIVRFWTTSSMKSKNGILEVVEYASGCLLPFYNSHYTEDEQGDWFDGGRGFEVVGNINKNKIQIKSGVFHLLNRTNLEI